MTGKFLSSLLSGYFIFVYTYLFIYIHTYCMFTSDYFNTSNMKVAAFEDVVFNIRLEMPSKLMKTLNQNYLSGAVGKARENKSGSMCFLILVKYGEQHLICYFINCFKLRIKLCIARIKLYQI